MVNKTDKKEKKKVKKKPTKKEINKPKEKIVHVAGKRKRAAARATIRKGKGLVRINGKMLNIYEPKLARLKIMEPLILAGELSKGVKIDINVHGGGWQSQAEASRLAIARGLVEFSGGDVLKRKFLEYDRHLLIADVRRKEPNKPNISKARGKRQKSYR
jgi:small subunit ribosomal protein S9